MGTLPDRTRGLKKMGNDCPRKRKQGIGWLMGDLKRGLNLYSHVVNKEKKLTVITGFMMNISQFLVL